MGSHLPVFPQKKKSALLPGLVTETPAEFLIGFLSHPLWKGGDYCDHPSLARGLLFDQPLHTGKRDYVNVWIPHQIQMGWREQLPQRRRVLFPEGGKRKYQEHERIFTRQDSPKPVLVSTWGQSSCSRVNVTAARLKSQTSCMSWLLTRCVWRKSLWLVEAQPADQHWSRGESKAASSEDVLSFCQGWTPRMLVSSGPPAVADLRGWLRELWWVFMVTEAKQLLWGWGWKWGYVRGSVRGDGSWNEQAVLGANMNSLAPGTQAEGRLPAGSFLEPLLANLCPSPLNAFCQFLITMLPTMCCPISAVHALCPLLDCNLHKDWDFCLFCLHLSLLRQRAPLCLRLWAGLPFQWLWLWVSIAGDTALIPGQGTKVPHAMQTSNLFGPH